MLLKQKKEVGRTDCNHDYVMTTKEECVQTSEVLSGQVSAVHMSNLNEKEANGEDLYSFAHIVSIMGHANAYRLT